jgi:hypothetical protein
VSCHHFLDSKTLRCAKCGKDADECRREQGRVAIAVSQPVPSNRVGDRVFLYGHEVRVGQKVSPVNSGERVRA